jgi:hypothetical protein
MMTDKECVVAIIVLFKAAILCFFVGLLVGWLII